MVEPLEHRLLFATTYAVKVLAASPITTSYDSEGIVRINNTYQVGSYFFSLTDKHGIRLKGSADLDLPPLKGGRESIATDISEGGVAAGSTFDDNKGFLVTTWTGGKPTNLGAGQAFAISSNGTYIAGSRDVVVNNVTATRAALFGSHAKGLGTFDGFSSHANDVNKSGWAVGQADDALGRPLPFWWNGSKLVNLSGGKENGEAFAISDSGLIVGELEFNAFVYNTKTKGTKFLNPATGTTGIDSAVALDVNNAGTIVGYSQHGSNVAATVWQSGTAYDLNKLIGKQSGWHLDYAKSINDKGQILAVGVVKVNGQLGSAAVLLSPNLASLGSTGTLTINGTLISDTVSVAIKSGKVSVTVNGVGQSFALSSVKRLSINLSDGDDTLTLGAGIPTATVNAGAGNDLLKVRNSVKDIIDGGGGSKDRAQIDSKDTHSNVETLLA